MASTTPPAAKSSTSNRRWLWIFFGLFIVYVVATLVGERIATRNLSPDPCTTLVCVAQSKPAPFHLAKVNVNDSAYFVWIGEIKPLWLAPSGRACYVFDEQGKLVIWDSDSHEGGEIETFCQLAYSAPSLKLADVLEELAKR